MKFPPYPKEEQEWIETPDGLLLDARIHHPRKMAIGRAIVAHPHPKQGGTMDNKVVTTTIRTLAALNFCTLRFDFRGVRNSEGRYDDGEGERIDLRSALRHIDRHQNNGIKVLAGFSFGSAMSSHIIAEGESTDYLILIGLPLATFDIPRPGLPKKLILITGDNDSYCPLDQARLWIERYKSDRAELRVVKDANHFFDGKQNELAEVIYEFLIANTNG